MDVDELLLGVLLMFVAIGTLVTILWLCVTMGY